MNVVKLNTSHVIIIKVLDAQLVNTAQVQIRETKASHKELQICKDINTSGTWYTF